MTFLQSSTEIGVLACHNMEGLSSKGQQLELLLGKFATKIINCDIKLITHDATSKEH